MNALLVIGGVVGFCYGMHFQDSTFSIYNEWEYRMPVGISIYISSSICVACGLGLL